MSFVPYPPPPPANGPIDNPHRQPTVLQSLALIAGLVLIMSIVGAVSSGSSSVLVVVAGASGLVLGFLLHALTRSQQRSSRSSR